MTALRLIFHLLVVRPLAHLVLGFSVRHAERLPASGPAILAPNHNSHLDALVLTAVLPLRVVARVRPVAAADYFASGPVRAWLSKSLLGAIPIHRGSPRRGEDPMAPLEEALRRGHILVLFPEGSRGDPERFGQMKTGITHLLRRMPDVPVIPVFMHGLGKALPRGEAVLVPFFCDIFVGEPLRWQNDRAEFMAALEQSLQGLRGELDARPWR